MKYTCAALLLIACCLKANNSSTLPESTYLDTSNWYESSWLGVYFESSNSWVYQTNLGWLYIPFSSTENFWIYHADLKWLWTTSSIYPWVYVNEIKDWRYYLPQLGFYRADTQTWSSPSELVTEFSQNDSVAYNSAYYSSGAITSNSNISAWFDRSLEINGLKLFVAGAVGGQIAVPDEWAQKINFCFLKFVNYIKTPLPPSFTLPHCILFCNVKPLVASS